MDHPVRDKQSKKFAKGLLNPSERFETADRDGAIEALSMMNGLEDLARQSVRDEAKAKEKTRPAAPAPRAPAAAAPKAPQQAPRVTYKTDNPQYKAALKDEAIIQALLDLHQKPAPKRFPKL